MIKNIFFDFDGTLGDSKGVGNVATKEAFEALGYVVPAIETMEYYMGIPIERSFKEMLQEEISDVDFERLLTRFREFYKRYESDYLSLFPGTQDMLRHLKGTGQRLYVASSKHSEALIRNLETLGIAGFFDDVVGSDMVSRFKPDPESIDYLVKKHDLERPESLMIGDAVFDLQMGRAAGVRTCAVSWGSHAEAALKAEHPDFIARNNAELTMILIGH